MNAAELRAKYLSGNKAPSPFLSQSQKKPVPATPIVAVKPAPAVKPPTTPIAQQLAEKFKVFTAPVTQAVQSFKLPETPIAASLAQKHNVVPKGKTPFPAAQPAPYTGKPLAERNEKIQAAPKSPITELYKKYVPKEIQEGVDIVKEAVVGKGQVVGLDGKMKADTGALGFFRPLGIGKTDFERYTERADALMEAGVDRERAGQIAAQFVKGTNTDPIKAPQIRKQQDETLKALAVTPEEKKKLDEVAFWEGLDTVFGALDLGGVGSIAKQGLKLTKEATEQAVRETFPGAIRSLLKKENPKISEEVLDVITPELQRANTPEKVQQILATAQERAKKLVPDADYKDAPLNGMVFGSKKPEAPASLEAEAKKYKSAEEFIASRGEPVYHGTVDTFDPKKIRDLGMHFGTKEQAQKVIDDAVQNYEIDPQTLIDGYGDQRAMNLVEARLDIKNPAKLVDRGTHSWDPYDLEKQIKEAGYVPKDTVIPIKNEDDLSGIKQALKDNGYDGIVYDNVYEGKGNSFIAFEPEQIRTADELRDIYTKATKGGANSADLAEDIRIIPTEEESMEQAARAASRGTKDPEQLRRMIDRERESLRIADSNPDLHTKAYGVDKRPEYSKRIKALEARLDAVESAQSKKVQTPDYTPSVALVKSISQTDDKFEILNQLTKEFPNLPERIKDVYVNKLARLKRTSDIEGILRIAKRMNDSKPKSLLNAAQKADINKSFPRAVADLMDESDKIEYLKNLSRKFEDQEQAVLAEHEFNELMKFTDQKVIDHYNDISLEREFLQDALNSMEGSELYNRFFKRHRRDPLDPTESLFDIMKKAQKKRTDRLESYQAGRSKRPPKLTPTEEAAIHMDTLVEEMGFKDLDEAQDALEAYARQRARLKELDQEVRELRPYIQSSTILRGYADEIPVIGTREASGIDRLANTADVRDTYKDISGFSTQARDIYRNFKRFFGTKFDDAKKFILDPFDNAKGGFVRSNKELGDELEDNIVKRFGFKKGSEESAAIQRYGDTDLPAGERLSYEDLVERFGAEKADKIVEADAWFRNRYNEMIEAVNEVRRKLYPNNPSKLVSYRKNYYHHYEELGDSFGDALRNFFDTPAGIDPKLAGISENTKPRSRFLAFAESRKGQKTEHDAIGGFIRYAPLYSYAVHIDPQISKFRYLRQSLARVAPTKGVSLPLLDELGQAIPGQAVQHRGIENMLIFLDRFTNDLAGKTHPLDRFVQEVVPGGRATMRALTFINNRIKANTILGNLGSALAQLANIPLGVSKARQHSAKGFARTIASLNPATRNEAPIARSPWIAERYADSLDDRFPFQLTDRPVTATIDEGRKKLAYILKVADKVGTEFIWNSMYEKFLAENVKKTGAAEIWKNGQNVQDAISYADNATRELVGGRGIGEVPLGQKSKLFQIVAPFQLEVGNFWHVIDDNTRAYYKGAGNKDLKFVLGIMVANWLFNEASENTRGSRVVYDPINALWDGTKSLVDETKEGNFGLGALKFVGRQAGEVLSNIPLGQTAASTLVPVDTRKVLFGEGDPARFGEVPLLPQTVQKVASAGIDSLTGTGDPLGDLGDAAKNLASIIFPYGSKQIEKTILGIESMLSGTVEDNKGNLAFEVKPTIQNWVRAALFGRNATSESREYFDTHSEAFKVLDRQEIKRQAEKVSAQAEWKRLKAIKEKDGKDAAQAAYETLRSEDKKLAEDVRDIGLAEKKGLDGNDRLIQMMGVENGERAKFLVLKFNSLETIEEKKAYAKELEDKGLLPSRVKEQIKILLRNEKKSPE